MKRLIYFHLKKWKIDKNRKPLLLRGARQTGKTYIVKTFGENEFSDLAYFNFEEDSALKSLFEKSIKSSEIIEALGLYRGKKIEQGETLIFFDEIQAAPRAITALKYFCEDAPEYHVASAGSLLGVSVGKTSSFPVGKVNFLNLYPMNFLEYLMAEDNETASDYLQKKTDCSALPEAIHEKLMLSYKKYLFLGGMPEAVVRYIKTGDVEAVRDIHNEILRSHEEDFSKYSSPSEAIRISQIWNSIPGQLSKENKKFKYSDVSKGARSSQYETAIEWLRKTGLIYVSYSLKKPSLPLAGFCDRSKFKIFISDTGLLGAKLKLPSRLIIDGDRLFSEYNGAFVENFTASEITANFDDDLYYWASNSDAEVDFIINIDSEIYPLEVKSGLSRRKRSLNSFKEKYSPRRSVRFSPRNFAKDNDFINIPLYAVSQVKKILRKN